MNPRCQAERYDLLLAWPHIERCSEPAVQEVIYKGEYIALCADHAILSVPGFDYGGEELSVKHPVTFEGRES